ncbi:kinase-like domain-containing protein [Xylariaceae sp. FL0662B]|nr:kinase-like domain-containing protein [Xylariaceae sp. FL0662B]
MSEESTYDYEWVQLEPIVRSLCKDLFPSDGHDTTIVEFLAEGGSNKVIAISTSLEGEKSEFVLRLPMEPEELPNQISCLKYLEKTTNLPIPRVVVYDITYENALQYPFMITNRIPGIPLSKALEDGITHEQRLAIAKDLGRLCGEILSIKSNRAGVICAAHNTSLTSKVFAKMQPLGVHSSDDNVDYVIPLDDNPACPLMACEAPDIPCEDIMLDAAEHCMNRDNRDEFLSNRWLRTGGIYMGMSRMGLFSDNDICLIHTDFYPRNIMVDINGTTPTVTGILDWDDTSFVPRSLANQPPTWLWIPSITENETRSDFSSWKAELETFNDILTEPPTPELVEVKKAFFEHVGEEYNSKPFTPELYIAHRLLLITTTEHMSDELLQIWGLFIKKWEEMRECHVSEDAGGSDQEPISDDPTGQPTTVEATEGTVARGWMAEFLRKFRFFFSCYLSSD